MPEQLQITNYQLLNTPHLNEKGHITVNSQQSTVNRQQSAVNRQPLTIFKPSLAKLALPAAAGTGTANKPHCGGYPSSCPKTARNLQFCTRSADLSDRNRAALQTRAEHPFVASVPATKYQFAAK